MVTVRCIESKKRFLCEMYSEMRNEISFKKYLFHVIMLDLVRQFLSLNSLTLFLYRRFWRS